MATSVCTASPLVEAIFREFDRLQISINQQYEIGLNLSEVDRVDVNPLTRCPIVRIYDDQESGYYDAESLLEKLKLLMVGDVNLRPDSAANIWQFLNDFEL